jgi:hypothetical protein
MILLKMNSLWMAGMLFLVVCPVLAMIGTFVVRRLIPLSELRTNNEVAGFKFATVGVLYAVLLAFAVLVVWEKLNEADATVAREASVTATLLRLANGVEGPAAAELREAIVGYLNAAIEGDWPAMAEGGESQDAIEGLNAIYRALLAYEPDDQRGAAVLAEGLRQADLLTEARRARIVVAAGIVPDVIWLVLVLGALVTIGFTFFFGTESVRAQALMTGALSLLIFSGLLTVVAIERPFDGIVRVDPTPLEIVLEDFAGRGGA